MAHVGGHLVYLFDDYADEQYSINLGENMTDFNKPANR